jgi:polysaccharide pyruvyl transferase WcaK-like protein
VYGWYNVSNLGDELFKPAFKKLFPQYTFTFVNNIEDYHIQNCDAIFFGGGSFLDNKIQTTIDKRKLLDKPILYIGVGLETSIHQDHGMLLSMAKLVASRNDGKISSIKIPDLVYALNDVEPSEMIQKTLLFLPNAFLLPKNRDYNCKFIAWNYFKSEVSQFLDELIEDNWKVSFYPMCQSEAVDDSWAANEIISMMKHGRRSLLIKDELHDIGSVIRMFSRNSIILTQRYHGIVLSDLANRPFVSISHHDKIVPDVSYFGIHKKDLHDLIKSKKNTTNYVRSFDILKEEVAKIL